MRFLGYNYDRYFRRLSLMMNAMQNVFPSRHLDASTLRLTGGHPPAGASSVGLQRSEVEDDGTSMLSGVWWAEVWWIVCLPGKPSVRASSLGQTVRAIKLVLTGLRTGCFGLLLTGAVSACSVHACSILNNFFFFLFTTLFFFVESFYLPLWRSEAPLR